MLAVLPLITSLGMHDEAVLRTTLVERAVYICKMPTPSQGAICFSPREGCPSGVHASGQRLLQR